MYEWKEEMNNSYKNIGRATVLKFNPSNSKLVHCGIFCLAKHKT